MDILTFDPKKSKLVKAGVFEDGLFTREVTSKHYMRIIQGYGIQEDAITKLKELDCKTVMLKTPTSTLMSKFDDWLKPNIRVSDFGHGKQRFLPEKYMERK